MRPLSTTDNLRGHLELLRALTQAPDLDEATYLDVIADMMVRGKRGGYYTVGAFALLPSPRSRSLARRGKDASVDC